MTRNARTDETVRVGSQLGRYRLEAELGKGGMGVVFLARDPVLDREVAIKVLPDVGGDESIRERFRREARVAARIDHPNVVRTYDVDREGGVDYLVMERVEGESLAARLDRDGHLDWREATRLMIDLSRGLAAAHARGLIHRDIKPGNVLLTAAGHGKLVDFGLAKEMGARTTSLTQSGAVLGTPSYMSPEQCRSEPADERSDVYSAGAMYYHLLTGRPPYRGHSPMEVMFAHCSAPPPDPREHLASLPEGCTAIVRGAMTKEPAKRTPTAAALLAQLEELLAERKAPPIPAPRGRPPVRPARSGTWPVALGVVAGLLALLAAGALLRGGGGEPVEPSDPDPPVAAGPAPRAPQETARGAPPAAAAEGSPRVLLFITASDFYYADYIRVKRRLDELGVRFDVASTRETATPGADSGRGDPVQGVRANVLIAKAQVEDYDIVIVSGTGSPGAQVQAEENAPLLSFVRRMAARDDRVVSGICGGPVFLAAAGLLGGRQATCFPGVSGLLPTYRASSTGEAVETDGRIVTGRSWDEAAPFVDEVLRVHRGE